jgi:hypothetical protein
VETAASIDYSPSRCNTCTQHIFLPLFCQSTGKKSREANGSETFGSPQDSNPAIRVVLLTHNQRRFFSVVDSWAGERELLFDAVLPELRVMSQYTG